MVVTRFAPSPTGELHLGHAYAAFFSQGLAQKHHGRHLLRFEDIDHTRVRPEFYQQIEEDLTWLGIQWEKPALRQSERLSAYEEALEVLRAKKVIYPCFCTRREIDAEIEQMTDAPHGSEDPLYPGTCAKIPDSERQARLQSGEAHCWRLDAERASDLTGPLLFHDQIWGMVGIDATILGDVVLARKGIATSYHLAVVVDDAFQQVTDVTRGDDLLSSTHIHRILQELLDLPEPVYHHHRLITDAAGQRLAKRDAAHSIRALRESGLTPEEVQASMQAQLGDKV